jgi:CBS domain-containing protein
MQASDIMTSPVIHVEPETPVQEIAALLLKHRISGVPVVEDGRLIGLVSEGDLLHRHEIGTDSPARAGSWWLRLFSGDRSPAEYVKSHGSRARDIMTRDVLSVAPDMPIADIATLLETRGIKRVPVLRGGQLIGIVSRSNLVHALAVIRQAQIPLTPPVDQDIRGRLLGELSRQSWWRATGSNVIVTEGVVHYFGTVESEDQRDAARIAAQNVPGVRGVEDHRFNMREISWTV